MIAFPPGPRALAKATATMRRRTAGKTYDVVHAHFGLSALPALAAHRGPVVVTLHGNDLFVRRSRLVTRAALPFTALPAVVSRSFGENLPGAGTTRRVAVLPVGIALERFRPIPRAEARARLGLDPAGRYLLFPHDPSRPLKRFDRAQEAAAGAQLLTMGRVPPDEVPYWINAAERRARAQPGRGLRALGDRGARVRRPRLRHAGRHPPRRARRDRRRVLRAVGRSPLARGAASGARGGRPAGRRAGPVRSCSPPTAWRSASSRPGRRSGRRRSGTYTRLFERVGDERS